MNLKGTVQEVKDMLDQETTKSNKELLLVAAICTLVGMIAGFFIGKVTTSKNTVKKFNKCYSYDFGDDEE